MFEDRKIFLLKNMNRLKNNIINGVYEDDVTYNDLTPGSTINFDESGNPLEPKHLTLKQKLSNQYLQQQKLMN